MQDKTNKNLKFNLPKSVDFIIDTLNNVGYEAYLVGGAVRDLILGKEPKDYDIATNATPNEIIELFTLVSKSMGTNINILNIGKSFGIITLVIDGEHYEIATFRKDGEYTDGRRPNEVTYTNSLKEDLSRRDFTINAMAYSHSSGIIDYYNGLRDILYKTIDTVGEASLRYEEDHLRMLRAIRFSSQLDFSLSLRAYRQISVSLQVCGFKVSQERIQKEINKILLSDNSTKGLRLLRDTELLEYVIPELSECVNFDQKNKHHNKDVFEHICKVVEVSPKNLISKLSALFHDIGKPLCFTIGEDNQGHFYNHHAISKDIAIKRMKFLKYPNKVVDLVALLVENHMYTFSSPIKENHAIRFINKFGEENLDYMFNLLIADKLGSTPPYTFDYIYEMKFMCQRVLNEEKALSLKDLEIDGNDIKTLGFQGRAIGEVLRLILDRVIDGELENDKATIETYILMNLINWRMGK